MRPLFIMSLICAVMSLLAIFGLSATTFVPTPDAERERTLMMSVGGVFFLVWLAVAFWARPRATAVAHALPPRWLGASDLRLSVGIRHVTVPTWLSFFR
jgi:hypothetical protein